MTEKNEISLYWNDHTVHDNWFISAEESYEYCIKRFNMYPKFREFAQMDRKHHDDIVLVLQFSINHTISLEWMFLEQL